MTVHSLLRHVGVDVPDFLFVGKNMIVEPKSEDISVETFELMGFMNGSFSPVLKRLICFFNQQTGDLKPKYLHPRELREFWASLNQQERFYYWNLCRDGEI